MRNRHDAPIKDAAAAWFVALRDEAATDADRAAFEAWCAADPAHRAAYDELERLWSGLDQMERRPQSASSAARPRGWNDRAVRHGGQTRRRALQRMAVAAALLLTIGLGGFALAPPGLLADYRTAAGEQRTIVLGDGSRLHLDSASAVSTNLTQEGRHITLHAGEAYFEVAHEPARPFVVDAGLGEVAVLGTAFAVSRAADLVEVIVTERRVAVTAPADGGGGEKVVVGAGNGVRVTADGVGAVRPYDTRTALAWREGRLVFDAAPLPRVFAEIDRYRSGRIMVMDDALGDIRVTGAFAIDSTDRALATIANTLPVRLVRVTDLLVLAFSDQPG